MIRILYFASLRETLGSDGETLELDRLPADATVAALRQHLHQRGGAWATALAPEARVLAAVNQDLARPETALADGDEVAFFPPVTGG